MTIFVWSIIFLVALFVLVRGAGVFIKNIEKIGVWFGLPSFVIGVLLVGVGTSLPELASGIAAIARGATEVVAANAIGSNIANILLIVGVLGVVGKRLVVDKDLLDSELPFFVISTVLFLGVAYDGTITFLEAGLLFSGYVIYLTYLFAGDKERDTVVIEKSKEVKEKRRRDGSFDWQTVSMTLLGLIAVLAGAHFLIESAITLATIAGISVGIISVTAIALGTSMPELFVSLAALKQKKIDLALGNIFGSNAFNILLAVGIPGLFSTLTLDERTFSVGLPVLAAASFIFLVIGLARKVYRWEGLLFLVFYLFFILTLLDGHFVG